MKTSTWRRKLAPIACVSATAVACLLTAIPVVADGLDHWHRRDAGASNYISALTYSPASGFVAVAQNGPLDFSGNSSALFTSQTGQTWESRPTGTNDLLTDRISHGNGQYRAVHWSQYPAPVGQLIRSTDGVEWTAEDPLGEELAIKSVKYVNGHWMVVAGPTGAPVIGIECGEPFGPPCPEQVLRLYLSPNGTSWRGVDLEVPRFGFLGGPFDMLGLVSADFAYGDSTWIVLAWVYQGSTFGITPPPVGLFAWRSVDGTNFVRSPVLFQTQANLANSFEPLPCGVTFGNGRFVAVANTGAIYSSVDGLFWATNSVNPPASLRDVTFGTGQFVAVGSRTGFSSGAIVTSGDGLNWRHREPVTAELLRQVKYGAHRFVVIGGTKVVLQSDPVISLGLTRGPEPRFTLSAPGASPYRIEFTSDIGSTAPWEVWTNVVVSMDPLVFPAPPVTESHRFFRAVMDQ